MKIGITGAGGFLGARLTEYFQKEEMRNKGIRVFPYDHHSLDFTSRQETERVLGRDLPDILIHTAAVSDIGACQKNPEWSERVNVTGTRYIADVCRAKGIRVIFCSSDQVYMGSPGLEPHEERETPLHPPTLYGQQKLRGEEYLLSVCGDPVILRLSWMFAADYQGRKEHGNLLSQLEEAIRSGQKKAFPVYDYRSVTDVWEVAANMEKMLEAPSGIYNFGSENQLSTYDLIWEFLRRRKLSWYVPEKDTRLFAGAPRNLRMNTRKARSAGAVFRTSLEALAAQENIWKNQNIVLEKR